jgi:hypothetical protein
VITRTLTFDEVGVHMIRKHVGSLMILGAALVAGCAHDEDGELITPPPVAGLRYINAVPDTGALDIRIADIVGNAPNTIAATFRSPGLPYGLPTGGAMPAHSAVTAGTRRIMAFNNSIDPAIASQVLLDTTYTFDAGVNYTVYLYGYARTAGTPRITALVTVDSTLTLQAGRFGVRVLNLAPTMAGNAAGSAATTIDARVNAINTAITGAATFTNVALGVPTSYAVFDTTGTTAAAAMRVAVLPAGAAFPNLVQGVMPLGTRGTTSANGVGGSAVQGTLMTAIIVPQSVTGSAAPQGAPAAVTTGIDSLVRSNDTVTVWRAITPATATACAAPVAAGAVVGDLINVSGITEPEYNGSHAIFSTTAGVAQNRWIQRTVTLTGATGAFTLSFGGATTSVLSNTATAAQVEAALGALTTVGAANVSVSGAAGGPYTIIFMGTFTNATVGALSASANGGLTAAVTSPAVGCGTNPLRTQNTITFTGAVATDSFRLSLGGQNTAWLRATTVTAAGIDSALEVLSTVGGSIAANNVTVSGAVGGPYTITLGNTTTSALNNQNLNLTATMGAGATGTVSNVKSAFTFSGAATANRLRYRIAGTPAPLATGTPSFRVVTAGNDYTGPSVLFVIDQKPVRTAP